MSAPAEMLFVLWEWPSRSERFVERELQALADLGCLPTLVVLVLLGAEMLILLLGSERFPATAASREGTLGEGALERLSTTLFTDYLFPFEVASVILLVALVGAIVLARSKAD